MAMTPTASAAPPPPMPDDATPMDDADAGAPPADDEAGDENVLFTVMLEADGTYSLVKGDEEDADGADTAGSAGPEDKQSFDSIGALLKGILDLLKESESSMGATGGSEDQFQSGFDASAPPAPAAPMAQKY